MMALCGHCWSPSCSQLHSVWPYVVVELSHGTVGGPGLRRLHTLSHPLPSPAKNMVVRGLENVEAPEGGEALFECQLSRPEVAAHTWLLDDEPVLSSENAEVVYFENGLRHLLLLKNLQPQNSCRVTFLAGDMVTSAFLTVRGAGCQLHS